MKTSLRLLVLGASLVIAATLAFTIALGVEPVAKWWFSRETLFQSGIVMFFITVALGSLVLIWKRNGNHPKNP